MKKPLVATISKFPPYMSGHSFEAMNQGRALYEITGYKHHEITYHSDIYDKATNYNHSPQLIRKAAHYLYVHRVKPVSSAKGKVLDGELTKAMIGKTINLIQKKGVNVLSTFYIDPHAYIANQAKLYADRILGKRIITVNKAVGSDVLSSIGNHLTDGQGKFILLQLLERDLSFAVSKYTKDKVIEYAKAILPPDIAGRISARLEVLYAPFDNEYFSKKNESVITHLKKKLRIKPGSKIISYFGRLFPEKGVDDLIRAYSLLKHDFPDSALVIGGHGIELPKLKNLVKELKLQDIKFAGAVSDLEKKGIMQMSDLGVIPTKPIRNFVETLCISALEYQASGTILLTTDVGGVPEAAGKHSLYAKHSNPKDLAKNIAAVLSGRFNPLFIKQEGLMHAAKFNYLKITKQFMKKVIQKHEQKKPVRVTISPTFLLGSNLKPYGRRYKI